MLHSENKLTADQANTLVTSFNELIKEDYIPEILCTISTLQTLYTEHMHHTGQNQLTNMHIHSIERIRMLFEVLFYSEKQ